MAAVLSGTAATARDTPEFAEARRIVDAHGKNAGMVAVVIDHTGTRADAYGNSGTPGVSLNGDTVFEIMSNTKVLTALLLADMVERGEVAFDDPVANYLPAGVMAHHNGRPITLLDLATYRSGLPNMPANVPPDWFATSVPMSRYTEAQFFEFLSGHVPQYAPGTHYAYANAAFGLLGIALARRAGKSYEALLIERVCAPLGLADTRITLTARMQSHLAQGQDLALKPFGLWDWPAMPGAGYARSTANNLARFIRACLSTAPGPLHAALARMTQTRTPTPLAGTEAAMGWYVTTGKGGEIAWKSGLSGGCNTFMGYSRQRRRGAVLMFNFLWQPLDSGTIAAGLKLIDADMPPADFDLLYPH